MYKDREKYWVFPRCKKSINFQGQGPEKKPKNWTEIAYFLDQLSHLNSRTKAIFVFSSRSATTFTCADKKLAYRPILTLLYNSTQLARNIKFQLELF